MHVSLGVYLVLFLAVMLGATVQGSIGFGVNMVAVPVMAIVIPEALPAAIIPIGLPLSVSMAVRERSHIDGPNVGWITLGRIPGAILAVVVLKLVSDEFLGVLAGSIVLVAVGLSFLAHEHRVTASRAAGTGTVMSFMGTTAGVEGPLAALLYQHAPGPVIRSTLGAIFTIGAVVAFIALGASGKVAWWQVWLAVSLLPAVGIGLVASRGLYSRLDGGWLRPAVLTFSAVAGVGAIVNAVL